MSGFDAYELPLSGTSLVEASAGTGKTYTIATLCLRLLLETPLHMTQILVVTFTRAATAELRHRIRGRLQDTLACLEGRGADEHPQLRAYLDARRSKRSDDVAKLNAALAEFDEAAVFTIHSFCQRALGDTALESRTSFDLDFIEDEVPLLQELVNDFWATLTYEASSFEVQALVEGGAGLPQLQALSSALRNATGPVLPESALAPENFPMEDWCAARDRVVSLWSNAREAVMLQLTSDALDKRSYGLDKQVPEICKTLDGLEKSSPSSLDGNALRKLTNAGLSAKTSKKKSTPKHAMFDACDLLYEIQEGYARYRERLVLHTKRKLADYLREERPLRKQERSVQGFDDLLNRLAGALQSDGRASLLRRLRQDYGAALIDEFQDTDPLQYEVFSDIFAGSERPLLLIGDPKQAIYGFRGADIFAYLKAAQAARGQTYTLQVNYRSDPGLVRAVNAVFGRPKLPFLVEGIAYQEVESSADIAPRPGLTLAEEAPLQFLQIDEEASEGDEGKDIEVHIAESMATEIIHLVEATAGAATGALHYGDVAVLCRTNKQVGAVYRALGERGIPCVLEADASVFDSPAAEDMQRLLAALANPEQPGLLRAALATRLFGVTASELLSMERQDVSWERWSTLFMQWHTLWNEAGFMTAFQRVVVETSMVKRLLSRRDGERLWTDVLHIAELLFEMALSLHLGPMALWQRLVELRNGQEWRALAGETTQLRLESDAQAVRITTVHKSKGLEYPIVYCPYLWKGVGRGVGERDAIFFHDRDDGDTLKADLGSEQFEQHKQCAAEEEVAEGLRVLYVALTRAKHRCYVVWAMPSKGSTEAPLFYLLYGGRGRAGLFDFYAWLKGAERTELVHKLNALCEASAGTISTRLLAEKSERRASPEVVARELTARVLSTLPRRDFSLQSFSGLLAHGLARASAEDAVERDGGSRAMSAVEAAVPHKVTLADLPGSARLGSLIHHVYEHLDFLLADEAAVQSQVFESVRSFGEEESLVAPLTRSVMETLTTPLDAGGLRLGQVARADRINELEFLLPVGDASAIVNTARLVELFSCSQSAVARGYSKALQNLSPTRFFGFLRGFIDLVFRHEGRYYLVDYKSNWLGPSANDYRGEKLHVEMVRHHYVLQYHLYTVALDRYLRSRVREYDYATHVGGVYYVFVRGMAPTHELGTGVFYDKPDAPLMLALSSFFEGRHGSG